MRRASSLRPRYRFDSCRGMRKRLAGGWLLWSCAGWRRRWGRAAPTDRLPRAPGAGRETGRAGRGAPAPRARRAAAAGRRRGAGPDGRQRRLAGAVARAAPRHPAPHREGRRAADAVRRSPSTGAATTGTSWTGSAGRWPGWRRRGRRRAGRRGDPDEMLTPTFAGRPPRPPRRRGRSRRGPGADVRGRRSPRDASRAIPTRS